MHDFEKGQMIWISLKQNLKPLKQNLYYAKSFFLSQNSLQFFELITEGAHLVQIFK